MELKIIHGGDDRLRLISYKFDTKSTLWFIKKEVGKKTKQKKNTGINFRRKRYHKNRASLQENALPKRIIDGSEYSVAQYLCIFLVVLGEGAQTCVGSQKPFLWALNGTRCIRPPANKKRRHHLVSVKHPITPQPFASAPSEKKIRFKKKSNLHASIFCSQPVRHKVRSSTNGSLVPLIEPANGKGSTCIPSEMCLGAKCGIH